MAEVAIDGLRACRVPALPGWKPGDPATLVLRPERLSVGPPVEGGLEGRIDQVAHLGNLVNYRIARGGHALLAQTPPGRAGAAAGGGGRPRLGRRRLGAGRP